MAGRRARLQIEALNQLEIAKAFKLNGYGSYFQFIIDNEINGIELMQMTEIKLRQYKPKLLTKQVQQLFLFISKIQKSPEQFDYDQKWDQDTNQPNQHMNQKPNQHMNQKQDQHMNQKPDQHINQKPNQHMNQKQDQHMNQKPDQHINQKPNPHMNQKPDQHINQKPNQHMNQKQDQHMNQKPDQHINQKPNPHMNQKPDQHMNQKQDQHMNHKPDQHINQKPNQHMNQKQDQHMNQQHLDQEPDEEIYGNYDIIVSNKDKNNTNQNNTFDNKNNSDMLAKKLKEELKVRGINNKTNETTDNNTIDDSNQVFVDDNDSEEFTDDSKDSFDDSSDDNDDIPKNVTEPRNSVKPSLPTTPKPIMNTPVPPKPLPNPQENKTLPRPPHKPPMIINNNISTHDTQDDQNSSGSIDFKIKRDALEQKFRLNIPMPNDNKGNVIIPPEEIKPPINRQNMGNTQIAEDNIVPAETNNPPVVIRNKPRNNKDNKIPKKNLPPVPIEEITPPIIRRNMQISIPVEEDEDPEYAEPDETNLHMAQQDELNSIMRTSGETHLQNKREPPPPPSPQPHQSGGLRNGLFEPQPRNINVDDLPDEIKNLTTEPILPPRPINDEYLLPVDLPTIKNSTTGPMLPRSPMDDARGRPLPQLPSNSVPDILKNHRYFRTWDRTKCNNFLRERPVGVFIIRTSSTYYAIIAVKGNSKVFNIPVMKMKNSYHLRGEIDNKFSNINQLVQHYMNNELSLTDSDVINLIDHLLPL